MFNKTVADIVAPLTKIAENLRKHAFAQMKQIDKHTEVVTEVTQMIDDCRTEVAAADSLAKKLEKLLSVDDDETNNAE